MIFFEEVDDAYGIDEDGPEPTENGNVAIPRVNFQLSPLRYFQPNFIFTNR